MKHLPILPSIPTQNPRLTILVDWVVQCQEEAVDKNREENEGVEVFVLDNRPATTRERIWQLQNLLKHVQRLPTRCGLHQLFVPLDPVLLPPFDPTFLHQIASARLPLDY